MGLASKVGNALTDFWSRNKLDDLDTPKKFSESIRYLPSASETVALNRIPEGVLSQSELEKYKADIHEYFGAANSPTQKSVERLCKQYEQCYQLLEQAMKVKTENLHMDLIERVRFLFFRILTAVGIAAVILGTSYLAKIWEIPIPMLRIAG